MSKIESFEIDIPQLKRARTVWVYLPDDYKQVGEPSPVIYMHDGQNLFYDKLTAYGTAWHVDKVMDEIYKTTGRGAIIVGVECYDRRRLSEYSPWKISPASLMKARKDVAKDKGNRGGEGKQYAEFFTKTLKTAVDAKYNTNKERHATAIIGSSMGGLISCYIGIKHQRLYETMYCGGKEGDCERESKIMADDSLNLYKRLSKRGIHCELLFNSDFKHYETAWGICFDKFARDFLNRYYSAK